MLGTPVRLAITSGHQYITIVPDNSAVTICTG